METLKVKIVGSSPLLMHNARFANPLDPLTQQHKLLTGKRKKTEEDHMAIMKSEYMSSLYVDEKAGVIIPSINVEACLFEAAKLQKLGKSSKRALCILEDVLPLQYKGPKTAEGLHSNPSFVDVRLVKVGQVKLMRCRPVFREWSVEFTVAFNPEQIQRHELVRIIEDAGQLIGLGDFRPRFGKFTAEVA